jgi:glycosyltransferase involved in cell wall biosynthesis
MKILWFPRLQLDIDKFHVTTWREMCIRLEHLGQNISIAIVGDDKNGVWGRPYIHIPIIPIKVLRLLSFWLNGTVVFTITYFRKKPDVVIFDLYSLWISAPLLLIKKAKRPLIIADNRTPLYYGIARSFSLTKRFTQIYEMLAYAYAKRFFDGMTVITDFYKRDLINKYGFAESTIGVWTSGVDLTCFDVEMSSPKESGRKDNFMLLQHGEISYNRGLFETVQAIGLLNNTKITLTLIGDAVRSNAKNDLIIHAARMGVSNQVEIIPRVAYKLIPKYIVQADCAIMAYPNIDYWNNNNPIKLLEYLAMGKLIIATDMWTFRSVMGDSKCVKYIKNNSPEEIANAIKYCLENKDKLPEWGHEGINIVKEKYTWDKQASYLMDFLGTLRNK